MSELAWLSLVALSLLVLLLTFSGAIGSRLSTYPPGPKPLPFIGNLLDLRAAKNPGPDYVEWGKKYHSDIVFATVFGKHILILNKHKDADELFERRSRLYSDRPHMPMADLVGWDSMVSVMPYGLYWRKCRKVFQQHFNISAAPKYHPVIQEKVYKFLAGLLDTPNMLASHNKMLSVSFAMAIMYGYEVAGIDDPMVNVADKAFALAGSLLQPQASLINTFPFLRHIPPWISGPLKSRRAAAEAQRLAKYMQKAMWDFSQNAVNDGTSTSSLVTDFLETKATDSSEEEAKILNDVAFTTYGGAAETTIAITKIFFFLMARHPEVQEKARAEIHALLGPERLPAFDDRPSLPYTEALYREVMRWQPSLPLAVPHALTEDDYYKGYFIPKGTTVIGNVWAMTRDEEVYQDPHSFRPERFLDKDGKLNKDDRVLAYGFGRRVCVGRSVASSMIWYMMVSTLACLRIGRAKDEFGHDVQLNETFSILGIMKQKDDYEISIEPLSCAYRERIDEKIQEKLAEGPKSARV